MPIPTSYLSPLLPKRLERLAELALDLRWSWNHAADKLWRQIDPELWDRTGNPWLILQTVSTTRLKALTVDSKFQTLLKDVFTEYQQASEVSTWFQQTQPESPLKIAFFCMEFGLSETLPIYSGGLGILAGDYLKTASDLGIPVTGIGLLYQQGYFRQAINSDGDQLEYFPFNDPNQLPVTPVRNDDGEWLRVAVDMPGRHLWVRVWKAKIGRVDLYLLDSNDPVNGPADRGITGELYGGGSELRLQQELILGIGGWRTLRALGIETNVCHLNEGHAAFAVVERAHSFMKSHDQSFDVALTATRAGTIFTTHTPVEAGFDHFSPDLISHYLGYYINELGLDLERFLELGRSDKRNNHEPFNMACLAMKGSGTVNAVSRLHAEVSRRLFQPYFPRWPYREIPVTSVTNGVHVPTWDSAAADNLWTAACGKGRWLGTIETLFDDLKKVSDSTLWNFRMEEARSLVEYIRKLLAQQLASVGVSEQEVKRCKHLLDPNILTIGFARRFTSYKRPNLLLHDQDRLIRILNHPQHPVQIIVAGKAHPKDYEGKAMIRSWSEFRHRPEAESRVVFIADYDMAIASHLVQGIDVWINTPRRPWEASGTSGMKVLVNGGLNISERDGWWAEAYRNEVGWAIGDGQEHDDDPAWDTAEAEQLYRILEEEIVPCFYERNDDDIPAKWVARMRASMADLTPQYSSNRMLREYIERLYLPAMQNFKKRIADNASQSVQLSHWRESLKTYWPKLRFKKMDSKEEGPDFIVTVEVYLDKLDPEAICLQLYAEPQDSGAPEIHPMNLMNSFEQRDNSYQYSVRIPALRPAEHYTPRIIPAFDGAQVPLESNLILWYER